MKKSVTDVLLIIFFLIFAVNVSATPVKVISNNSSVSGSYDAAYWTIWDENEGPPSGLVEVSGGYSNAGSAPQSGSVNFSYVDIDDFMNSVYVSAASNANLFNVLSSASANGVAYAEGSAKTDTIFRPLNDFNIINYSYQIAEPWNYNTYNLQGSLTDLTDNVVIWYEDNLVLWPGGTGTINYAFQSDHLYRIELYSHADGAQDYNTLSIGFTDLESVPEPATMLLLGIGLLGLAGVRMKFKR